MILLLASVLLLAANAYGDTSYTKIACENNRMELICSGYNVLNISSVNFGRTSATVCSENNAPTHSKNCRADGAFDTVYLKCHEKQHCLIEATRYIFGDPCFGTFKYLEVEYQCIPDPEGFKYGLTCEHTHLTISCNEDETIKIAKANYGRTTRSICNNGPIATEYCIHNKATQIAIDMCDNKQTCSLHADAKTFDDPCLDTFKYLWVQYKCKKRSL